MTLQTSVYKKSPILVNHSHYHITIMSSRITLIITKYLIFCKAL